MGADPAWDLLLDSYVHHRLDVSVSVNSACIAANVPQTTALRWIALLEQRKWLIRVRNPSNKRRFFLRLSDDAVLAIEGALDAAVESDRRLGLERLGPA